MKISYKTFILLVALAFLLLTACASNRVQDMYKAPRSGSMLVNPYHVNLHWIDYLRSNNPNQACADWIKWYLSKLNYPDKYGLTGTMNDYRLAPHKKWTDTAQYNSADSYAASFLILLRDFMAKGGKYNFTQDDINRIDDITWVILVLQNPNGTIKALPDSELCYLMDNCEDFSGLRAYIDLSKKLGLTKQEQVQKASISLYKALNTTWKDGDKYYWAISAGEKWKSDPDKIYPDRLAQLYPLAYGCLPKQSSTGELLWTTYSLPVQDVETKLSPEQKIVYKWAQEAIR